MSQVIPGGEEPSGGPIELARLQAAILESLAVCGLQNLQDAFAMYLKGSRSRLVKQGVIDLSVIFQPLSEDSSIERGQAVKVILLVCLYVQSVLKVPLAIPEGIRAEMDAALDGAKDLSELLPALVQGVERRLKTAAPAEAPSAAEKKAPKPAPKPARQTAQQTTLPKPTNRFDVQKTQQKKVGNAQSWLLGAFSILVLLGLGAYWGRFYLQYIHAQQAYRARQAALDLTAISEVLPATEVKEVANVLMVTAKNASFADEPPEVQMRLGARVLRTVNLPDLHYVQVFAGNRTIFLQKVGDTTRLIYNKQRF